MAQTTKYIKLIGSFTRPNNTIQYATGDVIGTSPASLIEFTSDGVNITSGQSLKIESAKIVTNNTGVFDCYLNLLDAEQTAIADNQADSILYANKANLIGSISVSLSNGSNCAYSISNSPLFVKTEANNIYGYITLASESYTPIAEQEFYVELLCALIDG
jgi:hypothetical protein